MAVIEERFRILGKDDSKVEGLKYLNNIDLYTKLRPLVAKYHLNDKDGKFYFLYIYNNTSTFNLCFISII